MQTSNPVEPRILVLGIGNLLLKDEGVGVHAIEALLRSHVFPPNVVLVDGGTAGLDMMDVLDGAAHAIVVDCVLADEPPGTLLRIPLDEPARPAAIPQSLHEVGILETLDLLHMLGRRPQTVLIGVQAATIALGLDLSPPVAAKLPAVEEAILHELERLGVHSTPAPPPD